MPLFVVSHDKMSCINFKIINQHETNLVCMCVYLLRLYTVHSARQKYGHEARKWLDFSIWQWQWHDKLARHHLTSHRVWKTCIRMHQCCHSCWMTAHFFIFLNNKRRESQLNNEFSFGTASLGHQFFSCCSEAMLQHFTRTYTICYIICEFAEKWIEIFASSDVRSIIIWILRTMCLFGLCQS